MKRGGQDLRVEERGVLPAASGSQLVGNNLGRRVTMAVLYTYQNDFKEDGSTLFQLHSVAQRKRWLIRVVNLKKDYQDLPGRVHR